MAPVVTWLGQAGFRFEAAGRRILVDPFFSEHEGRRYPPPPVEGDVDWLLVTHEHLDHLDPASLRAVAERSRDLTVHAVHPRDGYTDDPRFVGYVLELDGVTLYHAGDTLVTDAVVAALEPLSVDVALLPVNGRTYFREQADLAGNMDARDAVALAARIGASVLIPIHWDLFEGNTEHPGRAADEAAETDAPLHVLTLRRGLPWTAA